MKEATVENSTCYEIGNKLRINHDREEVLVISKSGARVNFKIFVGRDK
jgi:hypothetical protein